MSQEVFVTRTPVGMVELLHVEPQAFDKDEQEEVVSTLPSGGGREYHCFFAEEH